MPGEEPAMRITLQMRDTAQQVVGEAEALKFDISPNVKELVKSEEAETVTLATLKQICELSKSCETRVYLHELLKDSALIEQPPPVKPKNPKLVKRLKRLREEQENREYQRMVSSIVNTKDQRRIEASMELKSFNSQSSIALNLIATMATTFAIGWFLGKSYFSSQSLGLVCGLILCIIGMFVDVWLFVIRGSALDSHILKQEKLRKKRGGGSKILPQVKGLNDIGSIDPDLVSMES